MFCARNAELFLEHLEGNQKAFEELLQRKADQAVITSLRHDLWEALQKALAKAQTHPPAVTSNGIAGAPSPAPAPAPDEGDDTHAAQEGRGHVLPQSEDAPRQQESALADAPAEDPLGQGGARPLVWK